MKVDILLPIYNSPEETKNCIDSIIRETIAESFNLYLLDDCSTDPAINKILYDYSNQYDNIFAYRHESNKGFPGNVNYGLGITSNDVVILNSDTIVTRKWLDKFIIASNSQSKIGGINPLSNYGIISSVPSIYESVNNSYCSDKLINAIEELSMKEYPEVPMLIGYCMYITRAALDEVGLLDEQTFKKGYGEETDWCLRARKLGYKLIIADDSFVHHIGGASFGNEKYELIEKSGEIIDHRFPYYRDEIRMFENNHPLSELRKRLSKNLKVPLKFRIRHKLRLKKNNIKQFIKSTKISMLG